MYEEYLEDYVYKLMAKIASRICRIFKSEKNVSKGESTTECLALLENSSSIAPSSTNIEIIDKKSKNTVHNDTEEGSQEKDGDKVDNENADEKKALLNKDDSNAHKEKCDEQARRSEKKDFDENLNNLNFHMTLFFMWMVVTIVNIPALLTWARNYKYSMVLKPDTSYHTGLMMSICSCIIWQHDGPRRHLRYYEAVGSLLFTMAIFLLVLGPLSLMVVNHGVTLMFTIITIQQVWDRGDEDDVKNQTTDVSEADQKSDESNKLDGKEIEEDITNNKVEDDKEKNENNKENDQETGSGEELENCDVCSESRIYNIFKNLREKFSFNNDL